jgi:hypothetical protein
VLRLVLFQIEPRLELGKGERVRETECQLKMLAHEGPDPSVLQMAATAETLLHLRRAHTELLEVNLLDVKTKGIPASGDGRVEISVLFYSRPS